MYYALQERVASWLLPPLSSTSFLLCCECLRLWWEHEDLRSGAPSWVYHGSDLPEDNTMPSICNIINHHTQLHPSLLFGFQTEHKSKNKTESQNEQIKRTSSQERFSHRWVNLWLKKLMPLKNVRIHRIAANTPTAANHYLGLRKDNCNVEVHSSYVPMYTDQEIFQELPTYFLSVSHGALSSNHNLATSVLFELFGRHSPRSKYPSNKVELQITEII